MERQSGYDRTMILAAVVTPCIKVCVVDGESSLCLGCFRTLEEIAGWSRMEPDRREAIMSELADRRSRIDPAKLGPA